jgi:flagellar basal body-associated protein FliL
VKCDQLNSTSTLKDLTTKVQDNAFHHNSKSHEHAAQLTDPKVQPKPPVRPHVKHKALFADTREPNTCHATFIVTFPGMSDEGCQGMAKNISAMALSVKTSNRRTLTAASAYAAQQTSECPSQGNTANCDATMYLEAPTPAPTAVAGSSTTPAAEFIAAVITHEVTFKTLDPNTYTGDVKSTFETGYGISIETYDTAAKAYKKGNKVESSATAARRAGAKVTFKASVTAAHATKAQSLAKALAAAALTSAISSAKNVLGTTVTVPSAADVTIAAPTIAVTPTSAPTAAPTTKKSSDDDDMTLIIVLICLGVVILLIAGAVLACYYRNKAEATKEATEEDVDFQKSGIEMQEAPSMKTMEDSKAEEEDIPHEVVIEEESLPNFDGSHAADANSNYGRACC